MERRQVCGDVACESREGGGGKITGHAAVFWDGTPGSEYELWAGTFERIMPGAFDKSLADDVKGLYNHDPNQVLGRTKSGTMRINVDAKGLRYEIDTPETTIGRDVAESIRRGDVNGSSFSFSITDEIWLKVDGKRVREIRGVRLFDVGPVAFPAYAATTSGVRVIGDVDEARASLNRHDTADQLAAAFDARAARIRAIRVREIASA